MRYTLGCVVFVEWKDVQRIAIPHAPIHRSHQGSAGDGSRVSITEDVSEVVSEVHESVSEKIQEPRVPLRERDMTSWDDQRSSFAGDSCNPGYVPTLPSDTDLMVTAFFLFASFVCVVTICFELCYLCVSVLSSHIVPLSP